MNVQIKQIRDNYGWRKNEDFRPDATVLRQRG